MPHEVAILCRGKTLRTWFALFVSFQNISILYSLSNHLSRKILIYFLKGGVELLPSNWSVISTPRVSSTLLIDSKGALFSRFYLFSEYKYIILAF